jgi:hypothetical protein
LPFRLKRLAVTEEQIDEWNLPTRPTKRSDSRARSFGSSVSMELDAIDPRRLRSLVERAIRKHMPKKRYDELMAQEERERQGRVAARGARAAGGCLRRSMKSRMIGGVR